MCLQVDIWYQEGRLEDAQSKAFHALETFEKLGAEKDVEACRKFLQETEQAMINLSTGPPGELLDTVLHPTRLTSTF
jgi:hypothetical protein